MLFLDTGIKEKFVKKAREHGAVVVELSALLTTTMPAMEGAARAVTSELTGVKVMIGSAPVTEHFAHRIGAHGYGQNAPSAVRLARRLVGN